MSPGAMMACATILFAVDVPLVPKYVRFAPNVSAASCGACGGRPVGSCSESRPQQVADASARKMSTSHKPIMSLIQCELTIELPCEIDGAWKTPAGHVKSR